MSHQQSRPTAQFPESKTIGKREWGEEILLVHAPGAYIMKKLIIKAGKEGGLQFHRMKDEASYIVSGRLLVVYEDSSGNLSEKILESGECLHFPAGCIHKEVAITEVVIIEASTPIFNDRVRVESWFDHPGGEIGLPTTTVDEIIHG